MTEKKNKFKKPKLKMFFEWLEETRSENFKKKYCHLLLRENVVLRSKVIEELSNYFDSAHELARLHIRNLAGINLHPLDDRNDLDPASGYPEKLHPTTLQGYFGEVIAGIIAENYLLFESESWVVPAFLFHTHNVAFQQLELAKQTHEPVKNVPGRTGEDCIAFERDENGNIKRVMFCEAKCTTSHQTGLIKDNHEKLSLPHLCPVDLLQIIEALKYLDEEPEAEEWIESLRRFYFDQTTLDERCDLSSYTCGQKPITNESWISPVDPPATYKGKRKLSSAEVHIENVEKIISDIYSKIGNSA